MTPPLSNRLWISLSVRNLAESVAWYGRVFGFETVSKSGGWSVGEATILQEPRSGLSIGLVQHRAGDSSPFAETRVGLDHVEFYVPSRTDLDAWVDRLDELGVPHSDVKEQPGGNCIVTIRDPDNIQLELFFDAPR